MSPGETKLQKSFSLNTIDDSTVVEHLPHHPEIEGLSTAATALTRREKMPKTPI